MVAPIFDLKSFLVSFHSSSVASFVTNGHGFILEVNEASGRMFNVSNHLNMKSKQLVSFAHRKSTNDLHNVIKNISVKNNINSDKIEMRPRGSESFKARIQATIICKSNILTLIYWKIKDTSVSESIYDDGPVSMTG